MKPLLSALVNGHNARPVALNGFSDFVLNVYVWALLVAPVLTVPFAVMNAVTLNCYDDVMGEVEEAEDEEGEAPAGGEEPDVDVEGEDKAVEADK